MKEQERRRAKPGDKKVRDAIKPCFSPLDFMGDIADPDDDCFFWNPFLFFVAFEADVARRKGVSA